MESYENQGYQTLNIWAFSLWAVLNIGENLMMYKSKLAAAIKVNNRVLKEYGDTVYIPFGSEYAITLKNLHTTRAVVNVYIDGDNVVPGGLVLNAGQTVDLERSIRNNNLTEGNRFKFIERTGAVEQHRGVGVEDGLVRIEYQFEKVYVAPMTTVWNKGAYGGNDWVHPLGSTVSTNSMNVNGVLRSVDYSKGEYVKAQATATINNYCADNGILNQAEIHDGAATMDWMNDVGITVPGSKSEQKFQTAYIGALEAEKHNLIFKLVGDLGHNKPVEKPVTVKHKPRCQTCGHTNKANAQFCNQCGTALEIFA